MVPGWLPAVPAVPMIGNRRTIPTTSAWTDTNLLTSFFTNDTGPIPIHQPCWWKDGLILSQVQSVRSWHFSLCILVSCGSRGQATLLVPTCVT